MKFKVGDKVWCTNRRKEKSHSVNWTIEEGIKVGGIYTVIIAEDGDIVVREGKYKYWLTEKNFELVKRKKK